MFCVRGFRYLLGLFCYHNLDLRVILLYVQEVLVVCVGVRCVFMGGVVGVNWCKMCVGGMVCVCYHVCVCRGVAFL